MADTKWSQFPSATPGNSDEVVGLHSGDNARFTIANIIATIRQQISTFFVPKTDVGAANGVAELDSTGKVPSSQLPPISSDAEDITYDPTNSGLTATDVQAAIDEVVDDVDGKQSTITASGILKGDGVGGVSAATPGTDYQAPLTAGTDYATPAQLADKAAKADLTNIQATGTTNTTGAAIPAEAYFYLNGILYRAKTQIAVNATFTVNTNCEQVTGGGLNELKAAVTPAEYSQQEIGGIIGTTGGIVNNGIMFMRFYDFKPTATSGSLGSVPAAFKPKTTSYGVILSGDGSLTIGLAINVSTGEITFVNGNTSKYYYGTFIYPLKFS